MPGSGDKPNQPELSRRQQLEKHLRSSPTDMDGYLELAKIYRTDDRPLEAKKILEQAGKIFPDDATIRWEHEEAVLARSLQQFREVSELDQRLNTSETARELRRSQQDWACRRIEICRARLTRDKPKIHFLLSIAEAMHDADQFVDAINEAKPLLKIDEFSPQAYLVTGKCLLELGKDVEAMVALRAVAFRRAVPAPLKLRALALKLLCETAQRLGVNLSLERYQFALTQVEEQLTKQAS